MAPKKRTNGKACCPPKPAIDVRPLITAGKARDLANLFKVFANETRLRLLHALVRAGELRVTDLAETVGMRPQAVSNQLQRLADKGIVGSRRNGNNIFYSIADPCVPALLDQGLCLLEDAEARSRIPSEVVGSTSARSRRRKAATV